MADINYKPEGSVGHSVSEFFGGIWDEIKATPGNIAQHYKDHTLTAIAETFLPPLLILDADVRANDNANAPLSTQENSVKNMIEDSILKGNTSQLHDMIMMHSGDPTQLNRIMTQATQDLAQLGVKADWQVNDGKGQLHLSTDRHFMNVTTDGNTTFGDIRNGKETPASQGQTVDTYSRYIASDSQQAIQKRFQH